MQGCYLKVGDAGDADASDDGQVDEHAVERQNRLHLYITTYARCGSTAMHIQPIRTLQIAKCIQT